MCKLRAAEKTGYDYQGILDAAAACADPWFPATEKPQYMDNDAVKPKEKQEPQNVAAANKLNKPRKQKRPGDIDAPTDSESRNYAMETLQALVWLHRLPQEELYGVVIDVYRLRLDDEYTYEKTKRGLYAGGRNNKPIDDFRKFLRLADSANVLPRW